MSVVTPPTAEERVAWREQHSPFQPYQGRPDELWCRAETCDYHWPCPTRRLLDALEAAEARAERLRVASSRVVELYEVDGGAEWTIPSRFEAALMDLSKALADAGAKGATE